MSNPLNRNEEIGYYIEVWKQTVSVQQHFNDIEWRIRGLALTAATFAIGAAAVATKDGPPFAGTVILLIGLLLWYAFYFVDRYWYHPLLVASVRQGEHLEDELAKTLRATPTAPPGVTPTNMIPAISLTRGISAGSPVDRPFLVRVLTLGGDGKLQSASKLNWFYAFGAVALAATAIGLGVVSSLSAKSTNEPTIIRIERDELPTDPFKPAASTTLSPTTQLTASPSTASPAPDPIATTSALLVPSSSGP